MSLRLSGGGVANAAAWGVFALLFAAAVKIATALGFVGLIILGGATWLVCSRAALDEDAAGWGTEVFRARMGRSGSPEERAARAAERDGFQGPLRFFGRCGMALVAMGVAGFVWQRWWG